MVITSTRSRGGVLVAYAGWVRSQVTVEIRETEGFSRGHGGTEGGKEDEG
jgi:hypothetical protein